jgi:transposase
MEMSRAYSQDLRDRVIDAALKDDISARGAAARFGIGVATAVVCVRRARETGLRAAKPRGQPKRSKLDAHPNSILGWIDAKDDITIAEIREKLVVEHGLELSRSLWPDVRKKTAHATEQERPDVKQKREAWCDGQLDLDPARLIFIDETWASTNMARTRGRAMKGVQQGH